MTMSTAKEWSKFGVRTNSVCFDVVKTPMTETIGGDKFRDGVLVRIPMGRWATPVQRELDETEAKLNLRLKIGVGSKQRSDCFHKESQ